MDVDKWRKMTSMILYSLLLGIPGCGMALSDLGKGRTILDWIFLGAAYYLFIGFMLGLIEPNYWFLSAVSSWGPIGMSVLLLLFFRGQYSSRPAALIIPILFSILGGFLGSAARVKLRAK